MGSYDYGKREACAWIRETIPRDAEILDVGACDGKWRFLLSEYPNIDAVEAFMPNAERIMGDYRVVYPMEINDVEYDHYDLVIFGDMLEHLTVKQAQAALKYAEAHADRILIAIPYGYEQGAVYGNPYEIHKQSDLTPEVFEARYPGYAVLLRAADDYCYYIKDCRV